MKDCCPAMMFVLSKVRMTDRLGIMREQLLVFKTGRFITKLIARVHGSASFIELNYCPFCGKRVNNASAEKEAAAKSVDTIRGERLTARTTAVQARGDHPAHRASGKGKSTIACHRR